MTGMQLQNYLTVGALLFAIGMIGFLSRRNMILMFLSVETMLQGVAINLLAFSRYWGNLGGQSLVLFILTVAACEAAIALALILMLYRSRQSLDVSIWQDMREDDVDPTIDEGPTPTAPKGEPMPRLTPAGPEPVRRTQERSHV
ncbi:MAG: NADH-quinone oxidoreductase subunit NuoK [Gemmataceae bacterium]